MPIQIHRKINTLKLTSASVMLLISMLLPVYSNAEEKSYESKKLGTVTLPGEWTVVDNDSTIEAVKSDSTSFAYFCYQKKSEKLTTESLNLNLAAEYNIPTYSRKMDKKLLSDLDVKDGRYAHGTTTFVEGMEKAVRYYIIAIYETDKYFYKLITWTNNVPDGAKELSIIQRKWYINR